MPVGSKSKHACNRLWCVPAEGNCARPHDLLSRAFRPQVGGQTVQVRAVGAPPQMQAAPVMKARGEGDPHGIGRDRRRGKR